MSQADENGVLRSIRGTVLCVLLLLISFSLLGCSGLLSEARDAEAAGDYESAVGLYQARLRDEPNDLEALRGLTTLLYLQQRFDEVLPLQEKLVSLDPKDTQTRVELAFNYLNHQGEPAKAVSAFAEAAAVGPQRETPDLSRAGPDGSWGC